MTRITSGAWVIGFLAIAFGLQIGLFFFGDSSLRMPLRMGVYGVSLGLILAVPGRSRGLHPAYLWCQAAVIILLVELLNPEGEGAIARVATVVLYTSVLAPLIWVGRLRFTIPELRLAMVVMWGFYTASAAMGVLQAQYPGRFDGALANVTDEKSVLRNIIVMADGQKILRPKGLTDTPGGASTGGMYSVILGAGLLLTDRRWYVWAMAAAGMAVGLFSIYICYIRVNFVVVLIAMLILMAVLIRRGAVFRAGMLASILGAAALAGATAAFAVGGAAVADRFATLTQDDAATTYQTNRGSFLDELIQHDVWDYPLGAGLGRWGMLNAYFGTPDRALWAEMQWQALVFDGGVLLIAIYVGLFATLVWVAWRLAVSSRSPTVGYWAAVVLSYNVAAIAASFVFPIMAMQLGMEVALLNACLYGATRPAAKAGVGAATSRANFGDAAPVGSFGVAAGRVAL